MAETDAVLFYGGPCDGRWEQRLVSDLQDGHVTCGAKKYDAHAITGGYWLAVLPGVTVNVQAAAATAHNATRAWNRAMHSMNVGLPRRLAEAKQARLALLRSARR